MARPSDESALKRKSIEADYKRDSIRYTSIEKEFINYSNTMGKDVFMAYPMARECFERDNNKDYGYLVAGALYDYRIIEYPALGEYAEQGEHELCYYDDEIIHNKKMEAIDKYNRFIDEHKNSSIINIANLPIITNGKTLFQSHKTALVEIDFTKPLEEILAEVANIKNDFDNNPDTIQSTEEFLGIVEKQEVYLSTLKDEIYKKPSHKPLYGRLVDALFIYDCNSTGLTKSYALKEINWYWNEKNLFTETMSKNTLNNYLEFAQRQIDDGLYKNFISGQKNPLY
jgi:hypothetical protein